jgi:hypothetical protein
VTNESELAAEMEVIGSRDDRYIVLFVQTFFNSLYKGGFKHEVHKHAGTAIHGSRQLAGDLLGAP